MRRGGGGGIELCPESRKHSASAPKRFSMGAVRLVFVRLNENKQMPESVRLHSNQRAIRKRAT